MLKRLLPVALLASLLMILGCPGQPCGPGQIIDCKNKCIDQSDLNDSVGNGTCDEAFNCSEFDYDGGDCETTTTTTIDDGGTITSTISTTTTSSTVTACDLDSLLNGPAVSIHNVVDEWGACQWINVSLGVDTQGCEGEFYLKATCTEWDGYYSDCVVINIKEEDADKMRWIGPFRFEENRFCYPVAMLNFEFEVRNAQASDFTKCKKPPLPLIILPESYSNLYMQGESITFEGETKLSYDGELTGNSLVWTSSLDGQIGTGNSFTRSDLSIGEHTITLTATDSLGDVGEEEVLITIEAITTTTSIDVETDIYGLMVDIPGGTFEMGCADENEDCTYDEHQHTVTLTGFKMSKYEVTQGQWEAVMGSNPSWHNECGLDCPVENVTWDDIQDFISNLNEISGFNYRLPTEAEWEYATRAGTDTNWYCGNNESCLDSIAWYNNNSFYITHAVGQKTPNDWGLYDMSGNVAEVLQDWHDISYYYESPEYNPTGPDSGSDHVLRGGSNGDNAWYCSSYRRVSCPEWFNFSGIGFRLALSE